MDRNSIIGIIVIAGILIVWTTLNKPSKDEIEAAKYKKDSIELVRQQQIIQQEKVQATQIQNTQTEVATEASADKSQLKSMYGSFAESAEGKQEFTVLENELLKIVVWIALLSK